MTLPLGTRHGQLPFSEVDVAPLESHHLAASQPRLAAQQDHQKSQRLGPSHLHKPFELLEVVEGSFVLRRLLSNLIEHGTRPMTPHSTAVLSTVSTLLTVFGARSVSA